MTVQADLKQLEQYEKDLLTYRKKAFPFATKATINRAAFETRGRAQEIIGEKMVERNKFARNSVRVDQSRTLDVGRQAATVGSVAPFMATQEFGGVARSESGEHKPIPTAFSAGQGRGTRPRTRLPRRGNRMDRIQLTRRERRAKTRGQAVVLAAQEAVNTGRRFIYLDLGQKAGIFKVTGGKKNQKRGWPQGAKLQMVWDLTHTTVRVPANPWLRPATDAITPQLDRYYGEALRFQLRRAGILGYR